MLQECGAVFWWNSGSYDRPERHEVRCRREAGHRGAHAAVINGALPAFEWIGP